MNLKSDIYFKNLIQIVFFILFGVSSIVGQNMLIQLYIKEAWITFTLSSTWTVILIALYSYLVSVKEQKLKDGEIPLTPSVVKFILGEHKKVEAFHVTSID